MEPRAHHILIGVFTLTVAALAILFSLWLSKAGNENKTKTYMVVFTEAVQGLSRGSAVLFNGIRVGEVSKLELDPMDVRRVLAQIKIQSDIPIKEDTKARLALTGITGSSVIDLSGGQPDDPDLKGVDGGVPILYATPSPIAQLMAGGEELMTRVSDLLTNVNNFLSPDNADKIAGSLSHLEVLLAQLADGTHGLPELMTSLENTSNDTAALVNDLHKLVSKDGQQLFSQASEAMHSINQVAAQVQKLMDSNSGPIEQGSRGFAQLGPAMMELRQALTNIKIITQELQNNPAQYLLGNDKLQEFQP